MFSSPTVHDSSYQSQTVSERISISPPRSAPVHTIVEFVVHSLSSKGPHISPQVTSAWLFVCRQLYNTGEGLMCLEPYHLHMHIASAWKTVIIHNSQIDM